LYCSCDHDHGRRPPFPTRRSSDLDGDTVMLDSANIEFTVRLNSGGTSAVPSQNMVDSNNQDAAANSDSAATGSATTDAATTDARSEEHTSELQSRENLVCRLLLET